MMKKWLSRTRSQAGFTLIELIVVVAILGILAAVLTPRVMNAIDEARDKSAESAGKTIQLAMERYYVANGRYATAAVFAAAADPDNAPGNNDIVALLGTYANLDVTQFTGTPVYATTANQSGVITSYSLTVTLANNRQAIVTPSTVTVSRPGN